MEEKKLIPMNAEQDGTVEIDLLELVRNLWKHVIPIAALTVVCGVLAFLLTRFVIVPTYETTSSLYVVSASANSALDLSDLNIGTNLTQDYAKLVQSRTMLERVLEQTGDDLTVRALRDMLTVNNPSSTRILEFTITSTSQSQAQRLANAMLDQALTYLPEVMGAKDNTPSAIDTALFPENPNNMKYMRNIALGLIIGFLLAAVIYTIPMLTRDTFDSAEEVEHLLGIVPIAAVPENGRKHKGNRYYYYAHSGDRKKA